MHLFDHAFDLFEIAAAAFGGLEIEGPKECQNIPRVADPVDGEARPGSLGGDFPSQTLQIRLDRRGVIL